MYETAAELAGLQQLLDASLSGASAHLRSIVKPGERALTAAQLVAVCTGMCTLSLATVTARGEPRISAVDGHLLHGRWVFGTERSAAKARHLAARPAASVSHLRGEDLGVFAHGVAAPLNPPDRPADPAWPAVLEYLTGHYQESPTNWGEVVYYRLHAHWMVAYSPDPSGLLPAVAGAEG